MSKDYRSAECKSNTGKPLTPQNRSITLEEDQDQEQEQEQE